RLDTERNLPLSIIMADVNGLKLFNDAFGHAWGDSLLQKVAGILKAEFRADDIIARMGGDEFIILLPNTTSAIAEQLIDRVKPKIEQETIVDLNISVAFGWYTKTIESQKNVDIVKQAEDFMYRRKALTNLSNRSAVIQSILQTLLLKCPEEEAHSKRVGALCVALAKAYELPDIQIDGLRAAGELHDIGKIAIDASILNKPDKLSHDELQAIRHHSEIGQRLLGTSIEHFNMSKFVLSHHERWDGSGYPNGLKGEEIPWEARVMHLADAYDAMISDRSYRLALTAEQAINEIINCARTQFDPHIARVFVEKVLNRQWRNT
ncbi:MAG: diguanylate cyclase, partial [bacterium]|nr:diguanylate cyclase [bacterium]